MYNVVKKPKYLILLTKIFLILSLILYSNYSVAQSLAQTFREPTEIKGYYTVKKYRLVKIQNGSQSVNIHMYGTRNVDNWIFNSATDMVKNIVNSLKSNANKNKFNNHHVFVITKADPDIPTRAGAGHKNTGNAKYTIFSQNLICATAQDTLYPNLKAEWRAWDTPIHELGHSIEYALGLLTESDRRFPARVGFSLEKKREEFPWAIEEWFDAKIALTPAKLLARRNQVSTRNGYLKTLFNINNSWQPTCDRKKTYPNQSVMITR